MNVQPNPTNQETSPPTKPKRSKHITWLIILGIAIILLLVIFKTIMGKQVIPDQPIPPSSPTSSSQKTPSDTPEQAFAQFPVYPDATPGESQKVINTQQQEEYLASWESSDSLSTVTDWYMQQLTQGDWQIVTPPKDIPTLEEQVVRVNQPGLNYRLNIEAEDHGCQISLHITQRSVNK
jgi:hypothetical protein